MSDESDAGQRPMSRRDALKTAGLAGAAALSTGAASAAQAADGTPTAVQAKNPYGGVSSGGITLPPYYRPTLNLSSNNKVDLVTSEEIERIKAWLDERFHRYRLVEASGGNVPLELLVSVGRFDPSRPDGTPPHDQPNHPPDCDDPDCGHHVHGHRHDHSQVFRTWSYETEARLSLEALRETARRLPASIYRCKGVVYTAEELGRRVILQVVGKRVDIAVGDAWHGREPRTRIMAIGAHDGVDGAALREVFDRCRDATLHQAKQTRPALMGS